MSDGPTVLIMAAGEGTRMRSSLPKVLHPVCGRAMIAWPVLAARDAGASRTCVIRSPDRDLSGALPEGVETVIQPQADGTGGAIRAALDVVRESETVVVLSGDHPLISAAVVTALLDAHAAGGAAATVMTTELDEPAGYGRIVRDSAGDLERIVETKHPEGLAADVLAIREVNTGTYAFAAQPLIEAIERVAPDPDSGEYYLGEVLPLMRAAGQRVGAHLAGDAHVNLGVNDRAGLAAATAEARRRILDDHMCAGVTIVDPGSTWIDADVGVAADVTIEPGTALRGHTTVGAGSVIGPQTTILDSILGDGVAVPHSYLMACRVADGCQVGPFAYLRPDASLAAGAKAGSFVEIKNSLVGEGAKVPHLSYVGDADVGAGANVGAGTITANYDGARKHRTKIGRDARLGVDTALVAPVEIGDGAYTGASSVITEDVPAGALAVTRAEQRNVQGYAERKAAEADEGRQSSEEDGGER